MQHQMLDDWNRTESVDVSIWFCFQKNGDKQIYSKKHIYSFYVI